jgi:hypothetical protein
MAMPELTALDNAYQALQPLGQAARRRALQWLSDALVNGHILPETSAELEAPVEPEMTESTVESASIKVPARRTKKVAAPKTRSTKRLKAERPYRRMPDPDAIMKAYRKVGTVSGLADRFEVPRHTVNHWARRLRSQGYDIGRG